VLCQDVEKYTHIFKDLGFSQKEIEEIIKEANEVCEL
jgi:hypothetical protein